MRAVDLSFVTNMWRRRRGGKGTCSQTDTIQIVQHAFTKWNRILAKGRGVHRIFQRSVQRLERCDSRQARFVAGSPESEPEPAGRIDSGSKAFKDAALTAALAHVPEHGWSIEAVRRGVADAGYL